MTRVMLGLRLAARAGRARMFAVMGCSALGILLLLLCLDFPDVLHNPQDLVAPDDHFTYQLLSSVVALPIVILIAAISRLSSDTRDRRLSTLRLMGLPPGDAGTVASVETGFLVLVGSALGVCLHSALRTMAWKTALHHGLGFQVPQSALLRDLVVIITATAIVSIVAATPARRAGATLLQSVRTTRRGRFTHLFALLGLAGLITAGILAAFPSSHHTVAENRIPFMGFALISLIVGILGLTATVCSLLARALKRSSSPAHLIAAARTESDRASLGRAFAGLGAATFAAAFGLSVFTIFTTTPQYKSAAYWHGHETSFLASPLPGTTLASLRQALKESPDVVQADPTYSINSSGVASYDQVSSLTCAQIRTQASVSHCSDDRPWVAQVARARDDTIVIYGSTAPRYPSLHNFPLGSKHVDVSPAFTSPVTLNDTSSDAAILQLLNLRTLVLPPAWIAQHGIKPDSYFVLVKSGSRLSWNRDFTSKYRASEMPDVETWDQINGYRHLAYLVIGVVMSVGLLTVIVSVLDLLAERRRRVASLRMMGIPTSTLRRAQFLSTLVPMAATLILTLVAGYLMGRAYLNFAGEAGSTPTSQLTELLGIMLLFGIALAAATTTGLGRPLTANLIRRE